MVRVGHRQAAPAMAFASSYARLDGSLGKGVDFEAGAGAAGVVDRLDGGVTEGWAQQEELPSQQFPAAQQVPAHTRQQEAARQLQVSEESSIRHHVFSQLRLCR
jgi:hypothetical protein